MRINDGTGTFSLSQNPNTDKGFDVILADGDTYLDDDTLDDDVPEQIYLLLIMR